MLRRREGDACGSSVAHAPGVRAGFSTILQFPDTVVTLYCVWGSSMG